MGGLPGRTSLHAFLLVVLHTVVCTWGVYKIRVSYSQRMIMAAPESLEQLLCLRAVPVEKLEQVCLDDHLLELSLVFTDWQAVSPFLGLSKTKEEENEKQRSARRQMINVLRTWQAKLGGGGTYRCVSLVHEIRIDYCMTCEMCSVSVQTLNLRNGIYNRL